MSVLFRIMLILKRQSAPTERPRCSVSINEKLPAEASIFYQQKLSHNRPASAQTMLAIPKQAKAEYPKKGDRDYVQQEYQQAERAPGPCRYG